MTKEKKNIMKLLAVVLCLMLTIGLAACGASTPSKPTEAAAASEASEGGTTETTETTETTASAEKASVAQNNYPNSTIRIVSHSNPGSNDLYIRALQPYLQQELGVNVIIENVVGAAGRLASNEMWTAEPDGYNLYSMTIPLVVASDILYDADYDVLGFEYIYAFDRTPYAVVVKAGSPYENFDALLEAIKNGDMTNGTSGVGGSMHLQSMVMKKALGIDYVDVPFDGSANAVLGVMSGDVDFAIVPADVASTNEGETRALAVLAANRFSAYPDVPCTQELGYDFTTLDSIRGIVAPPGTPREVCDVVAKALDKATQAPEFQEFLQKNALELDVKNSEEYYEVAKDIYDSIYELKDLVDID